MDNADAMKSLQFLHDAGKDIELQSAAIALIVEKKFFPVTSILYQVFGDLLHSCNHRPNWAVSIAAYTKSMTRIQLLCEAFECQGYDLPFEKKPMLKAVIAWKANGHLEDKDRQSLFALKEGIPVWQPTLKFEDPLLTLPELCKRLAQDGFKPDYADWRSLGFALRRRKITPEVQGTRGRGKKPSKYRLSEVKKKLPTPIK